MLACETAKKLEVRFKVGEQRQKRQAPHVQELTQHELPLSA